MQNKNTFKIHTSLTPEAKKEAAPESAPVAVKTERIKKGAGTSERLLKNTAVACALLLSVMALKNIDTPVTNKITDTVKSVVNMDMNLDASIGQLSFVQKMMPESALVFLNLSETDAISLPVLGTVVHPYSEDQPWTEYLTSDTSDVHALFDGTIEACVETEEGDWTILLEGENGLKAVYAFIHEPLIKTGDSVKREEAIAKTGLGERARLYFEVRKDDLPVSPESITGV